MRFIFFFFKQKTAYEVVSRDWSSDVCSSDLALKFDCGKERICTMCNGALARFTVVNRAVAHCFKKVGHPGYRICYKYSRVCTTNQKYIQSAFVDSESVTSHQHPYGPKLDTVPYQCFIPYALFFLDTDLL